MHLFSPGWRNSRPDLTSTDLTWPDLTWHNLLSSAFQVDFMHAYKTKVAHGQASTSTHKHSASDSQLLHHSFVSNSLQPHGLQHARLPCPSPSPGALSTHVHWVSDAIQPFHPLSTPSPPAFNVSQHQGLFWVSSLHQVAKVLELQLQHQSFWWIFRTEYSQLLHNHNSQNLGRRWEGVGQESLTTPSWLICSFPTLAFVPWVSGVTFVFSIYLFNQLHQVLAAACELFSCGMRDLSSLSRDQTQAPCVGNVEH